MFNGVVLVVAVAFAIWRQNVAVKVRAQVKAEEIRQESGDRLADAAQVSKATGTG